jgi:hypothetical protein
MIDCADHRSDDRLPDVLIFVSLRVPFDKLRAGFVDS